MGISLISAVAQNRVIGGDNRMLWHLPSDFAYFKRVTMGKPIVMGRKTFDSIGRPLSGRTNIVITRNKHWTADGTKPVSDIRSAVTLAQAENADDIMIIGGANIYAQTIDMADTLYITEVDTPARGDALFPEIDLHIWHKHSVSDDISENGITYRFVIYKKQR